MSINTRMVTVFQLSLQVTAVAHINQCSRRQNTQQLFDARELFADAKMLTHASHIDMGSEKSWTHGFHQRLNTPATFAQ